VKIAIDFDGTIVGHCFPELGPPVPGAIEWMKNFQEAGVKLILWTMRSDRPDGQFLSDAIAYCKLNGIEFYGINHDPDQDSWTSSPKAYANIYIDDAAAGCPLREHPHGKVKRLCVDWSIVGPTVMQSILKR
jgi:hypothetical protein